MLVNGYMDLGGISDEIEGETAPPFQTPAPVHTSSPTVRWAHAKLVRNSWSTNIVVMKFDFVPRDGVMSGLDVGEELQMRYRCCGIFV